MILTLGLLTCAVMLPRPAPPEASFAAIVMVSGLAFLLGVAEVLRDNTADLYCRQLYLLPHWNGPMANYGALSKSWGPSSVRLWPKF